jgi:2-oxoglutarate ferredoxin oxidoreductase subunit alpha
MYNILIGGAAGQGIDTTVAILEKLLKRSGYYIYTTRDFMSRVRGGHNFSMIRFGTEKITSHSDRIDGIIALNDETIHLHQHKLTEKGFILCDSSLSYSEPGVIKLDMDKLAKELGNLRVSGSIAIGAVLKLFGEPFTYVEEVMAKLVRNELLEINLKAIQLGYESVEPVFEHLEGPFKDYMLISGSKALGLGAIAGGLNFYSAYPMSPSTAVMEYLARVSNGRQKMRLPLLIWLWVHPMQVPEQ